MSLPFFSSQPFSSFMPTSWPHRVALAAHLEFLEWWVMPTFPWPAISSTTPFTLDLDLASSIIIYHFFAALSSLLANSFFRLSIFVKYHRSHHQKTRKQHNYRLCCWIRNKREMHNGQPLTGSKRRERRVTDQGAHLWFTQWSQDWSASREVCTSCNDSVLLGGWFRLTKLWQLNSCISKLQIRSAFSGTYLAQLVKQATLDLGDMSSSPTLGVELTLKKKKRSAFI